MKMFAARGVPAFPALLFFVWTVLGHAQSPGAGLRPEQPPDSDSLFGEGGNDRLYGVLVPQLLSSEAFLRAHGANGARRPD